MKILSEALDKFIKRYPTEIEQRAASQGFKAGFDFAVQWIDVEKELPSDTSNVLVQNENGQIRLGWYMVTFKRWVDIVPVGQKDFGKVTHWRPIYKNYFI